MRRLLEWSGSVTWVRWPLALGLVTLWWWCGWNYCARWLPYEAFLVIVGGVVLMSALVTALVIRSHSWLFVGMVVASPCVGIPAWTAADAALAYSRGEAVYMSPGLVAAFPRYNLHPRLRVPMRYTGCMVDDLLRLRVAVNNATVETLVTSLGAMPGTYTGRLPTDEEVARALAERGQPVEGASEVAQWPVLVEGFLLEMRDEAHRVRVARLDDPRLLAVQIQWTADPIDRERRPLVIDLHNQTFLGGAEL